MTLTRRTLLAAVAATGAAAAGVGGRELSDHAGSGAPVRLGTQPAGLPEAQHAWEGALIRDEDGNPVAPRYNRLLMFDLAGAPTAARAAQLEAAMRTLERTYRWAPSGLLFVLGWGPHYFRTWLGTASPVPKPAVLSSFELPHLDSYDVCLHLAADDAQRLAAVEAALVHGRRLAGAGGSVDLRGVLTWRETRTGFSGAGLPARHQHVGGIPPGGVVPAGAPLFMGFKSALRRNQASEQAVTIPVGPLAGGTTMHVSRMRLALDSWYGLLDERQRVARMYAPEVSPAQVRRFTTDAPSDPASFATAARRHGVVGHSQASARARVRGRPRILRRDFDTVDGGEAGLHFVSLQRTIADFVATRRAMNADRAPYLNPAITPTVNNGINDFIFVLARANYAVPPRAQRSFPLLPGGLDA